MHPYRSRTRKIRVLTTNIIVGILIFGIVAFILGFGTVKSYQTIKEILFAPEAEEVDASLEDSIDIDLTPPDKYRFVTEKVVISTNDVDEYIRELESNLIAMIVDNDDLEEKYESVVSNSQEVLESDFQLYDEFRYVLNHPNSDFVLDDVKMVLDFIEEEGGVLNPHLWFSLVELESSYNSRAKNPNSTATGWGQVLRGTGKWLYENRLGLGQYDHERMAVNKEINARMSIHYLSYLIKEYGLERALIAYNGNELGRDYVTIISNKLKNNTNITFNQVAEKTRDVIIASKQDS